jgi:hypothetical protein
VVVLKTPLYDGIRHLLFLLPPVGAAAGAGLARATARWGPRWGGATLALFLGAAGLAAADMVALHPYEYVYANRSSGGLVAASGRSELDYWGTSYREAMAWVRDNWAGRRDGRPTRVAALAPRFLASSWVEDDPDTMRRFEIDGSFKSILERPADVVLTTTRTYGHRTPGRVLHVIERLGAPLCYILALDLEQPLAWRAFEGGRSAVELQLPTSLLIRPSWEAGDPSALYVLGGVEVGWEMLLKLPPGNPAMPDHPWMLRDAVAAQAQREWGPQGIGYELKPVETPWARGWSAAAVGQGVRSAISLSLLAAVQTGKTTVMVMVTGSPGPAWEALATLRPSQLRRSP